MPDQRNLDILDNNDSEDSEGEIGWEYQTNRLRDVVIYFSWEVDAPIECFIDLDKSRMNILLGGQKIAVFHYYRTLKRQGKLRIRPGEQECTFYVHRALLRLPMQEGQDKFVKIARDAKPIRVKSHTHIRIDYRSMGMVFYIGWDL